MQWSEPAMRNQFAYIQKSKPRRKSKQDWYRGLDGGAGVERRRRFGGGGSGTRQRGLGGGCDGGEGGSGGRGRSAARACGKRSVGPPVKAALGSAA